jgi:hypothetical protein
MSDLAERVDQHDDPAVLPYGFYRPAFYRRAYPFRRRLWGVPYAVPIAYPAAYPIAAYPVAVYPVGYPAPYAPYGYPYGPVVI